MMFTRLLAIASATVVLATAGTITIDDFSTDQGVLTTTGTLGPISIGPGITRTLTLTALSGQGPITHSAEVTAGVLDVTNGTGDDSALEVSYSLPALALPTGATNVRLTLRVVQSDANPTTLTLGGLGSGTFPIAGNTIDQDLDFVLAGPTVGPGVLTITLDGAPGWDMAIDSIGVSWTDPAETPEPGTMALLGLGLMSAAFWRKR